MSYEDAGRLLFCETTPLRLQISGFDVTNNPANLSHVSLFFDQLLASVGQSAIRQFTVLRASGFTYVTNGFGYARTGGLVTREEQAVIGAPTVASELGAMGSATYDVVSATSGVTITGQLLVFDAARRSLTGAVVARWATDAAPITLTFDGTLDTVSGVLTGIVTSSGGQPAGPFRGRFYGPNATELGLNLVYGASTSFRSATLLGRKR